MFHVVDKVDGVEMRDVKAKVEGRGTVAVRQPIPDRPELEQRFTKVLVCLSCTVSVICSGSEELLLDMYCH